MGLGCKAKLEAVSEAVKAHRTANSMLQIVRLLTVHARIHICCGWRGQFAGLVPWSVGQQLLADNDDAKDAQAQCPV